MPRKTLALIVGLVLVTIILFIIALRTGQDGASLKKEIAMNASPTPSAVSVLSLSPNPVAVVSGKQGVVNVMLDSSYNKVTAVQLEVKYSPLVVSNVKIAVGPLFPNAVSLIDDNNVKTGEYTFAFGISPKQKSVRGVGAVATITFTARGVIGQQSQIVLQPTTLVTAQGVTTSVLKSATGTTVVIGSATTTDVMQQVSTTPGLKTSPAVTKVPTQ